jgi:hypothetical protein
MEIASVAEVKKKKVWVEADIMGDKHVMVQHQAPEFEPFCYCSFHYDYGYTDNASIRSAASRMAIALGAVEPVEFRNRVPNAKVTGDAPNEKEQER